MAQQEGYQVITGAARAGGRKNLKSVCRRQEGHRMLHQDGTAGGIKSPYTKITEEKGNGRWRFQEFRAHYLNAAFAAQTQL
eukprot:1153366-Pelagomonas_calceolata.AAC.4